MKEEDSSTQVDGLPAVTEQQQIDRYSATQYILSQLDDYQIRVVLAFAEELLRD